MGIQELSRYDPIHCRHLKKTYSRYLWLPHSVKKALTDFTGHAHVVAADPRILPFSFDYLGLLQVPCYYPPKEGYFYGRFCLPDELPRMLNIFHPASIVYTN